MAINVIDRNEQKYFITDSQYEKLIKKIGKKIEEDLYFKERIYNLYFDNVNNYLINKSMDKPIYKEKIRLRSYEVPNDNSIVFLEIKKKFKDISNKRRIELKFKDVLNYIENGVIPNTESIIMNEIDYSFKRYNLKPNISITYDRFSYYLKEDSNFRITFDNNVRYSKNILKLDDLDSEEVLFKSGYIMEIKTLESVPIWFNKILDELNIYPTSYSKIGKIYTKIGGESYV
mgnify:CR=1 FL=1